jgi:hypothetical protein
VPQLEIDNKNNITLYLIISYHIVACFTRYYIKTTMTYLDKHKRTLGYLLIAYALLKIVLYIVGMQILTVALAFIMEESEILFAAYILKYVIGAIVIFISFPAIIAGIGLLNQKRWGLILALIIGIISLPVFPLGTALGVYAIIVFLMEHSEAYNPKEKEEGSSEAEVVA